MIFFFILCYGYPFQKNVRKIFIFCFLTDLSIKIYKHIITLHFTQSNIQLVMQLVLFCSVSNCYYFFSYYDDNFDHDHTMTE